ncbi:hypothetical protein RHSIM_Rhsim10G0070400 [Rhododendron simsii]|uniref:Ubiquitin-like protease family profile domain-containing protein n=1 Tax=Rhododendron simsii TaxID=118357 RepID=A0A834LCA1_RHOSS|nr:hypothetical protein RHSIM_Rhsim10G0070400 [Rhododendron simsii]
MRMQKFCIFVEQSDQVIESVQTQDFGLLSNEPTPLGCVHDLSILGSKQLFWLCEQINLLQQKNADAVPRLLKWNISELRDVLRDFDQLSQLPADQIYSNLGREQEGGEIEALELEVEKVTMSVDGESSQQAEVYREERVKKGATQVKQAEIEKEQRSEVLLCGEQAENYGTQRGESARGECAGVGFMAKQGNGQGLDDFNTPSNPSFEVDSPRKRRMENEMLKVQEEKEKALQHQKEEIEFLKWELEEKDLYISKLCKKNEVLEKLYKQYEEDVQHYETHELTQGYNVETERQVHQVTQKATFDTIKELREERDQLEGELINIKVHEVTQQVRAEKVLEKSKKKSPPSKFKRVKERDDRKTNFDENYVYGKLKRKSPQIEFVDVDDFQETSLPIQVQNPKKKLKNLEKCNTEISKLIRTETWLAIEQLWKAGNLSAVIWSSEADMLHIEVEDIQNLLFEDATSNPDTIRNRDKDKVKAMLGKVMRKSVGARFLLFPILVRFHWTLLVLDKDEGYWKFYNSLKHRSGKDEHCAATILLRQVLAAYVNIDQREPCKRNITDKVEIQKNSPEQPIVFTISPRASRDLRPLPDPAVPLLARARSEGTEPRQAGAAAVPLENHIGPVFVEFGVVLWREFMMAFGSHMYYR